MAELVAGAGARLEGASAHWLTQSRLPFEQEARVTLTVTDQQKTAGELELVYHPKTLVLGMGCERHAKPEEAIALAVSRVVSMEFFTGVMTSTSAMRKDLVKIKAFC